MNFNIVSAPAGRLSEVDYPKFKKDYLTSTLNYHKLRDKYGLSKKEYGEVVKRIKKEEGITHRPYVSAKYYYKNGKSYYIVKNINGVNIQYASFPCRRFNEQDMINIVNKFKELDWDYDKCVEYAESVKYWRRR